VVVASSPPPRSPQCARSRANPLRLNILHVSTFTSKILRCLAQLHANKLKDLAALATGASPSDATENPPLTPTLSRFYLQLLSIQKFCSCLPAKLMIPKDHRRRVYTLASVEVPTIVVLTPLRSRFYLQLLWIQRFCPCSPAKPMIPEIPSRGGIPGLSVFEHLLRAK